MLSVKNCRQLLGKEAKKFTDAELKILLEHLHCLGNLMLNLFQESESDRLKQEARPGFRTALDSFADSRREEIEERAAVLEFDGRIPREKAERLAIVDAVKDWDN